MFACRLSKNVKERKRERKYVHQEGAAAVLVKTVLVMSFFFLTFFRQSSGSLRFKHVQYTTQQTFWIIQHRHRFPHQYWT